MNLPGFERAQREWENRLPPEDEEPSAWAFDLATEKLIEDDSTFLEWIAQGGEIREPSHFFGSISTDEMLRLLVKPDATPDQCRAIGQELRQRFIDDNAERIDELAFELDERRKQDEESSAAERHWEQRNERAYL